MIRASDVLNNMKAIRNGASCVADACNLFGGTVVGSVDMSEIIQLNGLKEQRDKAKPLQDLFETNIFIWRNTGNC